MKKLFITLSLASLALAGCSDKSIGKSASPRKAPAVKPLASVWTATPGQTHTDFTSYDMTTVDFKKIGQYQFKATLFTGEVTNCILDLDVLPGQVRAETSHPAELYTFTCDSQAEEMKNVEMVFGVTRTKKGTIRWTSQKIFAEKVLTSANAEKVSYVEYR